jgi:hypothetical protein
LCEEAGVCWLDLSGTARLVAPGLRVTIEGKPNQFKRPGGLRSVFAPKSARIVGRWLLIQSDHAFTQRELAQAPGLRHPAPPSPMFQRFPRGKSPRLASTLRTLSAQWKGNWK